ncbi:MAG: DNA polymerase III subunit gamma/tau [Solirubrobacteraceae bacterium]
MSAGLSLYRRHRPRTFADVVGQEHVVRTLAHAVERDQIHHAYLFVGSRGTGKTSMAKILAACLNCINGPTTTPCGVCDSCVSIANATSLDVIEMDAASNNSVDDIRELREKVGFAPVSGRHKVYILDEAHMLSTQAWNAFLKTLEEPPPRTVFVLATTEAQKVLPTVVDRCHRFDFGRPTAEQIATVVRRVAERESIDIEDGATALIARHATGSFRDALGMLEQLLTYAGDARITGDDVLAVLGVTDGEQLFAAVDAVLAADPRTALRCVAGLAATGRDPGQILRDLETLARELLTVQIVGEVPGELRVTAERDERLRQQAQTLAPTDAVRLIELVTSALNATANGAQARIQLELALVKAAAPEMDPSLGALLARIANLEKRGIALTAGTSTGSTKPAVEPEPKLTAASDHALHSELAAEPVRPLSPPAAQTPPAAAQTPPAAPVAPTLAEIRRAWPAVLELVRASNTMLAVLLESARPTSVGEHELVLSFPAAAAFYKRKAEQDDYRRTTADAVRNLTGVALTLRYELADASQEADGPQTVPEPQPTPMSGDELVQKFMDEFDAEEISEDNEVES